MKLSEYISQIDWDNVQRVHLSRDGKFFSAAVEVNKKRHLLSIGIGNDATTMTISDLKGNILLHAVQQGGEVSFFTPPAGTASVFHPS